MEWTIEEQIEIRSICRWWQELEEASPGLHLGWGHNGGVEIDATRIAPITMPLRGPCRALLYFNRNAAPILVYNLRARTLGPITYEGDPCPLSELRARLEEALAESWRVPDEEVET